METSVNQKNMLMYHFFRFGSSVVEFNEHIGDVYAAHKGTIFLHSRWPGNVNGLFLFAAPSLAGVRRLNSCVAGYKDDATIVLPLDHFNLRFFVCPEVYRALPWLFKLHR